MGWIRNFSGAPLGKPSLRRPRKNGRITLRNIREMAGTGVGSCPVAGLDVSVVEGEI
jgi:hypothetical protein